MNGKKTDRNALPAVQNVAAAVEAKARAMVVMLRQGRAHGLITMRDEPRIDAV